MQVEATEFVVEQAIAEPTMGTNDDKWLENPPPHIISPIGTAMAENTRHHRRYSGRK